LEKLPPRYYIGGEGLGRLEMSARLNGDRLKQPLTVRGLHAGERMTPFGMEGHSLKLSDLYINRKLPQRARGAWPLVISGDEVAWAAGLRIGDSFKLDEQTRQVVRLEMLKI
jgi:tRNA(Ile)-lysidine synthase